MSYRDGLSAGTQVSKGRHLTLFILEAERFRQELKAVVWEAFFNGGSTRKDELTAGRWESKATLCLRSLNSTSIPTSHSRFVGASPLAQNARCWMDALW